MSKNFVNLSQIPVGSEFEIICYPGGGVHPNFVRVGVDETINEANNNNVQNGTSYTIQSNDHNKNIIFTNSSAISVTLPDTLPIHFTCTIIQAGGGTPTITPTTDTINGTSSPVAPITQWKALFLTKFIDAQWLAIF